MMLNMSHKFGNYTPQLQQQQQLDERNMPTTGGIGSASRCAVDYVGGTASAMTINELNLKTERESIHSGQFMVSHFEAEEAQDDLDDGEVKMIDPEDPKINEPTACLDLQLYVPHKVENYEQRVTHSDGLVTHKAVGKISSHLEIETSLTKLFKCMNLAYSQKLTSPKWNHFKGIRLRWKDKIRLNNVIWRCWHMQFILKRKTPVCQFASPLDVDIHSNPQSVVLEGKYWKRQLAVIQAEYRKWRRNYKSKVTGCLIYDTRSEFDFLEWSPLDSRALALSEDWTSDTLFSTINVPFPFPDSREIARGAGIADFIQPSLGPLQPNLDDIDFSFAELLQNTRLPPVPEEGADDMLQRVDYGLSAIMGVEEMDSSNIMDVQTNAVTPMQTNDDSNMLELNTPLNAMQFADIEQQFATRGQSGVTTNDRLMSAERSNAAVTTTTILSPQISPNGSQQQQRTPVKHYGGASSNESNLINRQSSGDLMTKSVIKGRISKNVQRPFRREPHNYDKAQPTLHQTSIYQQMLAEQQKNQLQQQHQQHHHHQQHHLHSSMQQVNQGTYQAQTHFNPAALAEQQQQQQTQNQAQTLVTSTASLPPTQQQQQYQQVTSNMLAANNSNNFVSAYHTDNNSNNSNDSTSSTLINIPNPSLAQATNSAMPPYLKIPKVEPTSNDVLAIFQAMNSTTPADTQQLYNNPTSNAIHAAVGGASVNLANGSTTAVAASNSYKPYLNFKKSNSTGTFINLRNIAQYYNPDQQQQQSTAMPAAAGLHAQNLTLNMMTLQQQQQQQHQQHRQQQQSQNAMQAQLSPTSSQQQQQQHQHSAMLLQHQQQQQQQQQQCVLPKEIYRSNSLPLNTSIKNLDTRLNNPETTNFAVPKYHAKSHKSRIRSNSMHQHSVPTSAAIQNANLMYNSNTNIAAVTSDHLQSAISDPMLNSTLAQLLTANTRIASLNKQQSSSTSAITKNLSVPPISSTSVNTNTVSSSSVITPSNHQLSGTPTNIFLPSKTNAQHTPQILTTTNLLHTKHIANTQQLQQQQQELYQRAQQQQQQQQRKEHHHQLQKSPKKSASLPIPPTQTAPMLQNHSKMLSYPLTASSQQLPSQSSHSNQHHVNLSPESFHDPDSPLSPSHTMKYPRENQRRVVHIHAEQKRRYNIKNGFDMLHSLIPQLQLNPNAKLSKAAMLQKGAEHIKQLRTERNILKDKMEALRMECDALNNSLSHLHSILPANGAPVTRQGTEHVRQLYEEYVHSRTRDNWKFWILGLILEPLLASYTTSVSSASMEELRRTAFLWVDQHCSLIDLRPAVSKKLRYLSMKTDILSDPPSLLQDEVSKAIRNTIGQHPNLHGT